MRAAPRRGKASASGGESPPRDARGEQITQQNSRENSPGAAVLDAREDGDGTVISVLAKPRASKTCVLGVEDGALKVALAAPPVDGAANAELVCALSEHFGIPKRRVTLVGGDTSRHKRVRLAGLGATDVVAKAARRR